MSKDSSAYDKMWEKIILPSIQLCKEELDNDFAMQAKVTISDLELYKEKLKEIYKRKREWLKREYLPNEDNPTLDFHKLSAVMCRSIIGVKPFCYDVDIAEEIFLRVSKDVSLKHSDMVGWQIRNVYVNYKLAFLVAEGINFVDLLYWAQKKLDTIKNDYSEEDIDKNIDNCGTKIEVYNKFIDLLNNSQHRLFNYARSESHDNFIISSIVALMKNDYLKRDFDYLQFAISMFQWQEYTKKQHLYDIIEQNNLEITLLDLV